MTNQTLKLYDYHRWANDRLFRRLRELPEGTVDEPLTSVFPTIREALIHLLRIETVWYGGVARQPFAESAAAAKEVPARAAGISLAGLEAMYGELTAKYRVYLESADPELAMELPHPAYGTLKTRLSELIQHLVNHGTYHRGNITAMLRQMGHAGPTTDYVFYLYEAAD